MPFTTLNKFDAEGHPIKTNTYKTEIEAQTRIVELDAMGLTDAFYVDADATAVDNNRCFQNSKHWIANLSNKTVSFDKTSFDAEVRTKGMRNLRGDRNQLLLQSDKSVNPDQWTLMNGNKQNEWSNYRQALRDLPANTPDPTNITWPEEPE